jgi:hypothetical protein
LIFGNCLLKLLFGSEFLRLSSYFVLIYGQFLGPFRPIKLGR